MLHRLDAFICVSQSLIIMSISERKPVIEILWGSVKKGGTMTSKVYINPFLHFVKTQIQNIFEQLLVLQNRLSPPSLSFSLVILIRCVLSGMRSNVR